MNEEALQYSYDLFKQDGYNGSVEEYKKLISEDKEALNYSFSLFSNDGYSGRRSSRYGFTVGRWFFGITANK